MPGQRGQLTAVGRLIECEKDDRQAPVVAEAAEQRAESFDIVGGTGYVRALVPAEAPEHDRVVVPSRAGVDLHDQAVFEAHRRHLGQHLPAEEVGLFAVQPSLDSSVEQVLALVRVEVGGRCCRVPMVGGSGTVTAEDLPPVPQGGQVLVPAGRISACQSAECLDVGREVFASRVDNRVGPERRDDLFAPAVDAQPFMGSELVKGRLGRGQHFDPEAVKEAPGAEIIPSQCCGYDVEVVVGGLSVQFDVQAEELHECLVEPKARRVARNRL